MQCASQWNRARQLWNAATPRADTEHICCWRKVICWLRSSEFLWKFTENPGISACGRIRNGCVIACCLELAIKAQLSRWAKTQMSLFLRGGNAAMTHLVKMCRVSSSPNCKNSSNTGNLGNFRNCWWSGCKLVSVISIVCFGNLHLGDCIRGKNTILETIVVLNRQRWCFWTSNRWGMSTCCWSPSLLSPAVRWTV